MLRHSTMTLLVLAATACGPQSASHINAEGQIGDAPAPPAPTTCPDVIGDATVTGKPANVVTHGTVTTKTAGTISYTVTTGYLPIFAQGTQTGDVKTCMFYFSYTRDDHTGDAAWPVSFLFNGGPGSASDWIHIGGNGPKAMEFGAEGIDAASGNVTDNADTLLAFSDLVFIDPINTGWSRPATGVAPTVYDGLTQEADSVGDFIQGFLTAARRTASPKYLVGESYAGMRIPVLSRYLDEKLNIKLAGITFISPWLDAIGDDYTDIADDLPYLTYLPELAATAWYHKKLSATEQAKTVYDVYAEAQAYADSDYIAALAAGDDVTPAQRTAVITRLGELTGMPATLVDSSNLRITVDQFRTQVLKDQNLTVAWYDARMTAVETDSSKDPFDAFDPVFATSDTSYFGTTLGYATTMPYAENNYPAWPGANPTGAIQGEYLTVLDDLNTLVTNNPNLKVSVAGGFFDLVCPPAEVQFMIRHLKPEVASRFQVHHYLAGHPVYFGSISRGLFAADMAAFIAQPAGATGDALAQLSLSR